MTRHLIALAGLTLLTVACGGDNAAPSPTTSAVSVTLTSPIRIGQSVQATGTATLSSGQSQAVTTGWQSDVPSVARVSDAGQVTGVANGRANIFVVSGGRQGQASLRVVPDYQGTWSGRLEVTSCTQTGSWAQINFCRDFPVGSSDPFGLSLAQSGESLTARANYGTDIVFPSVTSAIQPDGSTSFVTTFTSTTSPVITLEGSWSFNGPQSGQLVGTVNEVWRAVGISGEATLAQTIISPVRNSTTALSPSGDGFRSLKSLLEPRLRGLRR